MLAMLDGSFHSITGNAVPDETPHSSSRENLGEHEAMYPWRKEQNVIVDDENNTETRTEIPELKEELSVIRQTTLKILSTENPHDDTDNDQLSSTEASPLEWAIPMIPDIKNDHPLEIFVKSTSPAPTLQTASEKSGRRLADQIIDVMTEELTLRPVDDPLLTEASVHAAGAVPVPSFSHLTCINQNAMIALSCVFTVTTLISTVFITYLIRDVCCSWRNTSNHIGRFTAESLHSGCGSELTDESIDRQSDLPIYSRRLGEPSYVITTRNH
ncbi:hypothetical protein DICVIV_02642 [Dictyocaulus viviparus]|uniref:Uncharacterized protein n=1 Tax=Dictyocaulus viviparus TaxID=29172 RepID=A0A0D8Y3B7_DICVI|nr:hypothetical protein DICVIV_02642 [Dictyocaulus viviparus]